jgi:UDP-N-acetylmuramoyl-L-alanyl-D-glutamate--2,6-diaminopimelate ligase
VIALERGMSLPALLAGFADSAPDIPVAGLSTDSRSIRAGELFIALRGEQHDGRRYLSQAAAAGAVAALVEDAVADSVTPLPTVAIPDLRQRLGEIASRFYGHPSRKMHVAAVTGTNGKTTVSQLLAQLIRAAGYDCGVIGTLGVSLDARAQQSLHTTPDPVALQATLADWAAQAVPFVSMEASSHALDQGRMHGVDVDTAIFTNLSRDHLDYHGDMESYGRAKARLFAFDSLRTVVLNATEPFAEQLREVLPAGVAALSYGIEGSAADVRGGNLVQDAAGTKLRLSSPWGNATLRSPLLGDFNALNLLAALTAALQAGMPFDTLVSAVRSLQPIPGRMEPLRAPGAPLVVIDYAHTPDALSKVLESLRAQCPGRLIAVFGCGGDRDRGKRAPMAEAVSGAADYAVVTSDNPRSEDPLQIIADIEAAMRGDYRVEVDRAAAIAAAIQIAAPGDCVLIAGKGHEDYQIVGERRIPFSDSDVARQWLSRYAA